MKSDHAVLNDASGSTTGSRQHGQHTHAPTRRNAPHPARIAVLPAAATQPAARRQRPCAGPSLSPCAALAAVAAEITAQSAGVCGVCGVC